MMSITAPKDISNLFLRTIVFLVIFIFFLFLSPLLYSEPIRSKSEKYLNIFIPKGNIFISLDFLTSDAFGKTKLPKDLGDFSFVYQFLQRKATLSISAGLFERFSIFTGIPLEYRRFSGGPDFSSQIGIPKTSFQKTLEKFGFGDLEIGFETLFLKTGKFNLFSQFGVKIPTASIQNEHTALDITTQGVGTSNGQSDFSLLLGLMVKEKNFFINFSSAYIYRTPYEGLVMAIYPGEEIFFEPSLGLIVQNFLTGLRFPFTYLLPNSSGITFVGGSLPIEKSYSLSASYFLTSKFSDNLYTSLNLSLTLAEINPLFLLFPTFSKYPEGPGFSSSISVGYYF